MRHSSHYSPDISIHQLSSLTDCEGNTCSQRQSVEQSTNRRTMWDLLQRTDIYKAPSYSLSSQSNVFIIYSLTWFSLILVRGRWLFSTYQRPHINKSLSISSYRDAFVLDTRFINRLKQTEASHKQLIFCFHQDFFQGIILQFSETLHQTQTHKKCDFVWDCCPSILITLQVIKCSQEALPKTGISMLYNQLLYIW